MPLMGYGHATSGVLAASVVAWSNPSLVADNPAGAAALSLAVAGGAMLPDTDSPTATAANSLPPVSRWICKIVAAVSGGHRKGTHALVGLVVGAVFAALVVLPVFTVGPHMVSVSAWQRYTYSLANPLPAWASPSFSLPLGQVVMVATVSALALGALGWTKGWVGWFIAASVALISLASQVDPLWIVAAITLGAFIHIVGDGLTTQMVQPFWPFSDIKIGLPILGNAGSQREKVFVAAMWAATVFFVFDTLSGGVISAHVQHAFQGR